jgi:hypothetical protein
MILVYSLLFTAAFGLLTYQGNQALMVFVSLGVSVLFYIHQCVIAKTYGLRKVLSGDFLYQLAFMGWLLYFRAPHFLHYIPLLLSNVGKVTIMALQKGEQHTAVQDLILFQNHTEAFVLFTLFLEVFSLRTEHLLRWIAYGLLIKLKYRFYAPTRKAYNQIHFELDRRSRNLNLRGAYHLLHDCLSLFSSDAEGRPSNVEAYY